MSARDHNLTALYPQASATPMSALSPASMPAQNVIALPIDGRQSPTALKVQRGTCRLLRALGFACLTELPLGSGRRADVTAISKQGEIWIVEIKSSVADFRADMKWPLYRNHCDKLFFAAPDDMDHAILPESAGLILADAYGADIQRWPAPTPLAAARRRALVQRFARTAAQRLTQVLDPDPTRL